METTLGDDVKGERGELMINKGIKGNLCLSKRKIGEPLSEKNEIKKVLEK